MAIDTKKFLLEVEILDPKPGDILVIRTDLGAERIWRELETLKGHPKLQGLQVIIIPGETDMSSVSEEEMNRAGWYRREASGD